MSRQQAIEQITQYFESGEFLTSLASRVAIPSESQTPQGFPSLTDYLTQEIIPCLNAMGFSCEILPNPTSDDPTAWPFLLAERIENPDLITLLTYGHGDVVRGYADEWRVGLNPWTLQVEVISGTGEEPQTTRGSIRLT
ncbi:hypothetical protein P4S72_20755 [Vibrio sp. PP-XX7]